MRYSASSARSGLFGGVLVNVAFRQSFLTTGNADGSYPTFIAVFAVYLAVTYVGSLRSSRHLAGV